jgi:hypothetical protein
MTAQHHYHEVWINVAHASKAEHGNCPSQVILTFENSEAVREFMESICNGREVIGGGVRHDEGRHCPVHP